MRSPRMFPKFPLQFHQLTGKFPIVWKFSELSAQFFRASHDFPDIHFPWMFLEFPEKFRSMSGETFSNFRRYLVETSLKIFSNFQGSSHNIWKVPWASRKVLLRGFWRSLSELAGKFSQTSEDVSWNHLEFQESASNSWRKPIHFAFYALYKVAQTFSDGRREGTTSTEARRMSRNVPQISLKIPWICREAPQTLKTSWTFSAVLSRLQRKFTNYSEQIPWTFLEFPVPIAFWRHSFRLPKQICSNFLENFTRFLRKFSWTSS